MLPSAVPQAFNIAPQSMDAALNEFSRLTGLPLAFDAARVRTRFSPGVVGIMPPREALAILAGQALRLRLAEARTATFAHGVALAQAAGDGQEVMLEEVVVEGGASGQPPATGTIGQPPPAYPGGQVALGARVGLLGNESVFDTPFAVGSFTEELIRDQGSRSVEDVVRNDPSVNTTSSGGNDSQGLWIRGVEINPYAGFAFDGLLGLTDQYLPALEGIERVELIKGPNVLLNGFGSVAGFINLVPKRATAEPITRIITDYQSDAQLGTHLDFGRRWGDGQEWGIRLNGRYRKGDSYQDENEVTFGFGSAALDYQGERFRFAADVQGDQRKFDGFDYGAYLAGGVELPDAPSGRINLGPGSTFEESDHIQGSVRAEYDLLPNLTAFAAVGASNFDPYYFYPYTGIINGEGDTLTQIYVDDSYFWNRTGEAGLRGEADTGPIGHEFAVVGSYFHQKRDQLTTGQVGPDILSNIYRSVSLSRPSLSGAEIFPYDSKETYRGLAIADTMSAWDDRVKLTVGARWQSFHTEASYLAVDYEADRVSPGVGLVVKPLKENLSLYANYVEGLESGGIASPPASNAGEVFPAFVAEQVEVGAKYDFGDFGATLAAFQITRPNQLYDPVANLASATGEQEYRGLELNLFGEVATGLRLLGGVTFLDTEIKRSADNNGDGEGDFDGNEVPGALSYRVALYGEYDLPFDWSRGVTLTGRLSHISPTYYNAANSIEVPEVTLVDIGARYEFETEAGRRWRLQGQVENLFDKDYWQVGANGGSLTTGAPRTFYVAATIDF